MCSSSVEGPFRPIDPEERPEEKPPVKGDKSSDIAHSILKDGAKGDSIADLRDTPPPIKDRKVQEEGHTTKNQAIQSAAHIAPPLSKKDQAINHAQYVFKEFVSSEKSYRTKEPQKSGKKLIPSETSSLEISKQWTESLLDGGKVPSSSRHLLTKFHAKLGTLSEYSSEIEKKLTEIRDMKSFDKQIEAFETFAKGDLFQGYLNLLQGEDGALDLRHQILLANEDNLNLIGSFQSATSCLFQKAMRYPLTTKELVKPLSEPVEGIPNATREKASSALTAIQKKSTVLNRSSGLLEAKRTLTNITKNFSSTDKLVLENEMLRSRPKSMKSLASNLVPKDVKNYFSPTKEKKSNPNLDDNRPPPLKKLDHLVSFILAEGTLEDVQKVIPQLDTLSNSTWGKAPTEKETLANLSKQATRRAIKLFLG